jgi:hypothetical protein
MGSKPRDQGTMSNASGGAQAADQALAAQATQNSAYAKQAHDTLFGPGTDGKGGTLSKFLDPSSLNVSGPTGTYGLQYNQAVSNIAKQSQDVRGSVARAAANRGFGANAPAGFVQDQQRRAAEDQVGQQGAAFTDYAGKSYQDALQNFWNSTNIATGAGAAATNAAIAGDSAAANNYANLYGTASTPNPSVLGGLLGAGIQAGGQIGSAYASGGTSTAAAKCPCEGGMLLAMDGTEKAVEYWRKGEELKGIDGKPCPLLADPRIVVRDSVEVKSLRNKTRVSSEHTFALPLGGYEFAFKSKALNVRIGNDSIGTVLEVIELGAKDVYVLEIGGSHSYRVDGFWSLS